MFEYSGKRQNDPATRNLHAKKQYEGRALAHTVATSHIAQRQTAGEKGINEKKKGGKTRIIFVNGKIGGRSAPAGIQYWNGKGYDPKKHRESRFVRGAKDYFNTQDVHYTAEDYNYFSSAQDRSQLGMLYAHRYINKLTAGLDQSKDQLAFVTHSMGSAFAEGMVDILVDRGWKVDQVIHIAAFQASDMQIEDPNSNEIITVDYQLTDDWVINSVPQGAPGDIRGADLRIREKGGESWTTNHTSPMWKQGKQFWKKLERQTIKLRR